MVDCYRRRIAFISEHASPAAVRGGADAGGQNVYVDELSRHLGQIGFEVDVFTRRDAADAPPVLDWAPNVRIVNLPVGPARFMPKDELWPFMPAFRDAFVRFCRQDGTRYDLIHGNFWMSGWVATELKRELGVPAVQNFHALGTTKQRHQGAADTSPSGRIAVEHATIRDVDCVIAQCPQERLELVGDYGARPERIALIPAAVNTTTFRPVPRDEARRRIGLDDAGPVIVYVGRMLPRKGVRNVVRALAILRSRWNGASPRQSNGFHRTERGEPLLLLVGGGTSEPSCEATAEIAELKRLAAELGVADRVRFAGRRQPDVLHLYYGAGDVAVTTPWYEPFGLTPLEAMACARPVIGSAVGGITYTVRDGETGFLVPPRDPEALAVRLDFLLTRPALSDQMGAAGRRRVEGSFTWATAAASTAELYAELMAEREAPTAVRPLMGLGTYLGGDGVGNR